MIDNTSKALMNSVAALSMLCATTLCVADVFEVVNPQSFQTQSFYPGLDLNQVNGVTLVTSAFDIDNPEPSLNQVKIDFKNANDLIVRNLTLSTDGTYRGFVNGAWIYKTVSVEINTANRFAEGAPFDAVIRIVENRNALSSSDDMGPDIARISGSLKDVTPNNKVADRAVATVQGKRLALNLKQRCVTNPMDGQSGFKIDASWMGNGDRALYVSGPGAPAGQCHFKAVALDVTPVPGLSGEYEFRVTYEDNFGGPKMTTPPMPLDFLLRQGYDMI